MPKEFSRTRRIGEQMRRDLAPLLRDTIPGSQRVMVSITSIKVSPDLAHAKVYITALSDPAERSAIVASLNQAAPALRHALGQKMYIRSVPRLEFIYDEVVERGARLSHLISQAVATDAARHQRDQSNEEESGG